ncbi:sucrose-6-phosphate hydrolase [Enterococcus sp. HY326]|uniref:sucrose-6-phosphate hydrolase n=1 Tax=Enterococcus sp. HY326 TaxID=2971265 RepID=UPI002240AB62|nr:sucrose-6-phosphate hydrolase [Enterococcus sp. HY326]
MTLITDWTQALRYQKYDQWSSAYLAELKEKVTQSPWRLGYHIQPETGLLNDPNGFSFYNGKWQLFYQAFPLGPIHGLKSWFHLTSENLVDWKPEGIALLPDSEFDSHGVYSGSALPVGNQLFLAYTGNVRDENWQRQSYQMGAWLNQDNQIEKISAPLISPDPNYTDHFRDPQVFAYEDSYLMLLGAQDQELKGKVLTYQSENLKDWQLLGELDYTKEEMGFMVECPNLIFIEGRPVLLFCPQGLAQDTFAYQNIYPNTYVMGSEFKLTENKILDATPLKNLDEGFEVYATQVFNAPDGRALGVSWIGLPEIDYPSDQDGWAHCLSIVKEFKIVNEQLLQQPVAEMQELRETQTDFSGTISNDSEKIAGPMPHQYELKLNLAAGAVGQLDLFADEAGHKFSIHFDTVRGTMTINRGQSGLTFGEEFGVTRHFEIATGELALQIFVDASVVEIFINDGQQVATARVFPTSSQSSIYLSGEKISYSGQLWSLRKMK